jgi:hypothetical protein
MKDTNRIDFDYSHVGQQWQGEYRSTQDMALVISTYLIESIRADDLIEEQVYNPDSKETHLIDAWGAGYKMNCWTQTHQRCLLASYLATYGAYKMASCDLGPNDYEILVALKEEADCDVDRFCNAQYGRGVKDYTESVQLYLGLVIAWFEQEYSEKNPEWSKELIWKKLKT